MNIAIAIPTYGREKPLVDSIRSVLAVAPKGTPLLILDQTPEHSRLVAEQLAKFVSNGEIQHVKLSPPSITRSMNFALRELSARFVLYLDDDVILEPGLVEAYLLAHQQSRAKLIAGRVIQPWQEGLDFSNASAFHFATLKPLYVDQFMGGNFSIERQAAVAIGGFDENFARVAYNFEAEFAHRWREAGHGIYFEPAATIHHLKIAAGGTRSFGHHLRTSRPDHSVGAYYYILRTWKGWKSLLDLVERPVKAVVTRHHLAKPWWIPMTLLGELRGFVWAARMAWRGPQLINAAVSAMEAKKHE